MDFAIISLPIQIDIDAKELSIGSLSAHGQKLICFIVEDFNLEMFNAIWVYVINTIN
jgi:hypothetical protein